MSFKRCVVSVAFREPYLSHADKLREAIKKAGVKTMIWKNTYPHRGKTIHVIDNDVSHFQRYLYSFKPWMVKLAMEAGYNSVIWLDPSYLPLDNINLLFDQLEQTEMIVKKGEHKLSSLCLDRVADWFKVSKTVMDLAGLRAIGGTIYGFNFTRKKAKETFDLWLKSEEAGCFGDQDDHCLRNHWADESCMGLCLHKTGVETISGENFKFKNQKEG